MDTDIQQFYRNKSVFLTGGTGFMGLVFIEKLLRATEVQHIYVMVRPKKGKTIEERLMDMFKKPIFDGLKQTRPDAMKRVLAVFGDCALPNLGLSSIDRQLLIERVQVVLHSAATVRFDDPLYKAVVINVRATLDLLQLAKQMLKLEAFVYVSTAFAHCVVTRIDEKYYVKNLGISAVKMCELAESLGAESTNSLKDVICKHYPNTYIFTKSLAEEAMLSEARTLPACIFRPAIVIQTYREPLIGWVGNFYGPSTMLYGASRGVLRVVYVKTQQRAQMVPADYCANLMVAMPWAIDKYRKQNPRANVAPSIYNYVPDDSNPVQWSDYIGSVRKCADKIPLSNMIWYPFALTTGFKWWYHILCFFYHTIPGYIFDFLLILKGKKTRMSQLYRKINSLIDVFERFMCTEFHFSMDNTKQLWTSMSAVDQELFNFDMCDIDWTDYLYKSLLGMRLYLGHESPETIPKALRRFRKFLILHRIVQVIVYGSLLLLICSFINKVVLAN